MHEPRTSVGTGAQLPALDCASLKLFGIWVMVFSPDADEWITESRLSPGPGGGARKGHSGTSCI